MTPNLNRNLKFNPNFVKGIETAFTKSLDGKIKQGKGFQILSPKERKLKFLRLKPAKNNMFSSFTTIQMDHKGELKFKHPSMYVIDSQVDYMLTCIFIGKQQLIVAH